MARPANSTFMQICDKIAATSMQRPAPSAALFATDTRLPSTYVLIKNYVDIANRLAVLRMNERFLIKEFRIITTSGTGYPYPLDDSVSVEGLKYHSFRCSTPGAERPLYAWNAMADDSYLAFRQMYPDLTQIPSGPPQSYVVKAQASNETNAHNLLVYPTPDAQYTIEYQAKLDPVELINATDVIQWPKVYEVTLIMFAKALFQNELGIQNVDGITAVAEQALAAVKAWGSGALEGRPRQRQSVRFKSGRASYGRFDFNNTAGW